MKKTIAATIACVLLLAVAVGFTWDRLVQADESCCKNREKVYKVPPPTIDKPENANLPEYVPYMFLFQHISNVKGAMWQLEELRSRSDLSEQEFGKIVAAAARYGKEVAKYDARAKVLIDEFHRQFPPGKLPEGTGPGEPPSEIDELQKLRDNAALKYRDEVKSQLDPTRFESFVDKEFKVKVTKQRLGQSLYATKEGE